MKPVIGITCDVTNRYEDNGRYDVSMNNARAISLAGGVPVLLPYDTDNIDEYIEVLDGIVFTGGGDISPALLDEDPNKNIGSICTARDDFELTLCKKAYEKHIPMIGICRGLQVINVALGGTLYQDINSLMPNAMCHKQAGTPMCEYFHKVKIKQNSMLKDIMGDTVIYTNSYHHQAVKGVPETFEVVAHTSDNVVEAIEYERADNFILGLQWHPECMINVHPEAMKIYNYFIEQCNKKKKELTE